MSNSISINSIIQHNEMIRKRNIHGTIFVLDISEHYYNDICSLYELNETGEFIWDQIDGKKTIKKICEVLYDYVSDDIDRAVLNQDVMSFINDLYEKKFIEVKMYG